MRGNPTPEDKRHFYPLFLFVIWPALLRCLYFQKAGEKPFKALIPFYGSYKFFDLFFHRRFFWIYLLLWVMKMVTLAFLGNAEFYYALSNTLDILIFLIAILPFATGAWRMGEGVVFSVFTFLLYPLFAAIVVFQKEPPKDKENTKE